MKGFSMSGTEGNNNIQSGTETQSNNNATNQSGADLNAEIQSLHLLLL